MTREEAIRLLSGLMFKGKLKEAIDMAIKALEQEPNIDELRAEITALQHRCYTLTKGLMCGFCRCECRYKAESEPQESEDINGTQP